MPSKKTSFSILFLAAAGLLAAVGVAHSADQSKPAAGAAHQAESPRLRAARLNGLGIGLMNQQLTAKAAAKLEEAHQADPSSAIPVMNRGIALLYLQKLAEAQQELQKATQMAPKNPRTWYNLALTEMDQAHQKAAIEYMQKAVALVPDDADAHYFVGQLQLMQGNTSAAVDEFRAALKLNPTHCSAQFGLARALQQMGKTQEAQVHLKIFEHLTAAKLSTPLGVGYGDRGDLSTMEEMKLPPLKVGPMIPVHFQALPIGTGAADSVSRGECAIDIEAPGSQDLVVMGSGSHAIRAYKNLHNGHFQELPVSATGLDASGQALACAAGDFDNDGKMDLAVALKGRVILYRNMGGGHFQDVTAKVGIRQLNDPAGLTFVDFDHDGDLDLFVTGSKKPGSKYGPNVLWRNNGNSTFTEWTGPTALAGHGSTRQAMLSDINNDRAVDLVVANAAGAPTIYLNPRDGAFKPMQLYNDPALSPTRGLAIFDYNKDGWMDVAVTHTGAPGLTLWRNVKGKHFERVPLPLPPGVTGGWGVTPIDVDNDSWIDLAAVLQVGDKSELRVFRNMGPAGFKDVTAQLGLDKIDLKDPRSVIAADVLGDGGQDLIVTQKNGPPVLLRNIGGNKNHWLRIRLVGLADNRSGIETKVQVFAGGRWQKFEVAGSSGYGSQNSTEIEAGLGKATEVDVVRLLWPTGVPQDEINKPADDTIGLQELDRRGSSCPVLFAWNGKQYKFISDVIGAAVVGHWVSPTATNKNDPGEWIKVPGRDLKARNGLLSLRFGEPMEEVNYIDQLRLVAVDHPANVTVYPDERFLSEPPFASGKTVAVTDPRPLAGAWMNGQSVLPRLTKIDGQFVSGFHALHYDGFANMHTLTLDLGKWSPKRPLWLLMNGYVNYFSASSMYSAWQAGLHPIPPRVDVQMPDGSWKRVIDDMGFPAGLSRTITVNLTGKLPPGARKIRISTNLQIYWNQILVDNGPNEIGTVHRTNIPLDMAHLEFRGYPEQVEGKSPGDLTYNYQRISKTGPFLWAQGLYTRYGNVTPLLRRIDNQYVIFGTGDEIDAEFSASALPPLPKGWKRDYFFYANGFVKDMDFWEAEPFTVTQMPFQQMTSYPYPASEHYPQTASADGYVLNWDTRFESGKKDQRWDFNYQPVHETPIQ